MARVAGVDIPSSKRVLISLTYIYGIGRVRSKNLLEKVKIDPNKRVKDLTDSELGDIKKVIELDYEVEGALRKEIKLAIDRLRYINSYIGTRHRKGLNTRGQRTKTNARTRKGPSKMAVKNKVKPSKK
jgi:small subunit ribosomal protein S13